MATTVRPAVSAMWDRRVQGELSGPGALLGTRAPADPAHDLFDLLLPEEASA